ncbi:MAG: 3-deoxy-7-phosphoheptulonate synthase [Opitutales bacterium]|nr:3-deoxy-7-phosphoheptulonate synthase [Opitutales bacterium]
MSQVSDLNVLNTEPLPSPFAIREEIPVSSELSDRVFGYRKSITDILFGEDERLILIVGPCSIHDTGAGLEYAKKLKELASRVEDRIYLVMRSYFEKPRTSIGWKGLIMDPMLDNSCNLPQGLKTARKFLLDLIDLGLPTATELLDPITPQFIADLICWSAVGARTTESQTHRQMASGLSMPLGFKNTTSGDLQPAINAVKAASAPMTFMGINYIGQASAVSTKGNPHCHVILRGGNGITNYDEASIRSTEEILEKNGLMKSITVDCSHANSGKDHQLQPEVMKNVIQSRVNGLNSVRAIMLESNLFEGNQKFPVVEGELKYGTSITDACIGWEDTEAAVLAAYDQLG